MLTKTQKRQVVEDLADKIKRQQSLIFTDVSRVSVKELQKLRKGLKQVGIDYKVFKKSLIDLALKKTEQDINISDMVGSLGLAFSYQNPISPAQIIFKFAKEHKNMKILGGIMEDRFLTFDEVEVLSKIPSREELLAKFTWSIKGPISGFVNVLAGNIRNLVGVLIAIKNK